jgi:hypothetical protein
MNRRLFLRGVGGATLAAPILWTMGHRGARAQDVPAIKRSVIFFTHYGCIVPRWYGKLRHHTGPIDATMLDDTLAPLAPHAGKLLFPQGLAMFPRGSYIEHTEPHDQAPASMLTCAPLMDEDLFFSQGHSLDWEISRKLNPPGITSSPLALRIGEVFTGVGVPDPGLAVREFISYEAPQTPYTPETNPLGAYNRLTGMFGDKESEADYLVAQGKSIIDVVQDDLDTMRRVPMSADDQRKVDDWLALLRETELSVVPLACRSEIAEAMGVSQDAVVAAVGTDQETQWKAGGDMMMKLITLAMMCDANRSLLLHWDGEVLFKWDGMDMQNVHHGLSHRDSNTGVENEDPSVVENMVQQIDAWYAGRFANLVTLIDSVAEGEGTMLDNSVVMWIPEMSDGNLHNCDDLPVCIAGGLGGYLKQGYSVQLDSLGKDDSDEHRGHPVNRLYTTVLNGLGITDEQGMPVQSFGVLDNNDYDPENPLETHILHPGEVEEIKAG